MLPFTSHWTLGFSRTVGHRYRNDCPTVEPMADGRYLIRAADGSEPGTADAAGGVALVLSALEQAPPA